MPSRLGSDGSIRIHCPKCGEYLYTSPTYAGFSTVTCVKCQAKQEAIRKELEKQK